MGIEVGTIIHGLKIIALCGGGAYGDVYYCEDISGKRLALKVINKKHLGNVWERELQGVINYRRITESAPHLLRIFHVAEDEDTFYYTMEAADSVSADGYLPDTLAQRLQSGPLPKEQLYPVLRGIFEGIKTIHEAGFAHRDIKPDNILFVGGVPKLADIGLLSSLSNTMTSLAGTLEFLPPEVRAADSPGSSDRASRQRGDLYAFGKVIYCAATGLEPGSFPTVPTQLTLSHELKLLMALVNRLCAKSVADRLCDIETVSVEFDRMEQEPERPGDPNSAWKKPSRFSGLLRDIAARMGKNLKWLSDHSETLLDHAALIILTATIASIATYWIMRITSSSDTAPALSAQTKHSDIFDLNHGRTYNDRAVLKHKVDIQFKTPRGWGVGNYYTNTFRRGGTIRQIGAHVHLWIGMGESERSKASSYIRMDELDGLTTDEFANFSQDQLKNAIRKSLYLDIILPMPKVMSMLKLDYSVLESNMQTLYCDLVSGAYLEKGYRKLMENVQNVIPEESIKVGDLKKTTVSGHPALYAEISSPLTHKDRRMLYCLIAIKKKDCCFSILLDADAKEFALREKQFAEFLKHMDF